MNELMTLEVAEIPRNAPRPHRRRRVTIATVVALAAAAALIFGVGRPGGSSPLSAPPASAAVVALRAVATEQRAQPDTPPDLTGVAPQIAALLPLMREFPTAGTAAEVWSWVDAHCHAVDLIAAKGREDCGLTAVFGFLQVSTATQKATLLDALATLPTLSTVGPCANGGAVLRGPSQEFRVSRNGSDIVLTLTHSPMGQLWMSMATWVKTVPPPCARVMPQS